MRTKWKSASHTAAVLPEPAPLLVDIKRAAAILGVSPFAVRNLCWNPKTKTLLRPVRHGLKFLFAPASLKEFADALVAGTVEFPRTPSQRRKQKGRAA